MTRSKSYKYQRASESPVLDLDLLDNLVDPLTAKDIEILYNLLKNDDDKVLRDWDRTQRNKPDKINAVVDSVEWRLAGNTRLSLKLIELFDYLNE